MQICPFDSASAGSKPTDDNSFVYLNTAALKIYSWIISSEVHFNWSQLRGHTTESKYVKPADDSIPMPSWITHGRFLECSLSMVLAKWSAESKSVSLGLPRFETYRWQLFVYRNTPCNSLMDSFVRGSVGLRPVVITTDLKSVSHGLSRFETCRQYSFFFLSEHTLTFSVLRGLSSCSSRALPMWLHSRIQICLSWIAQVRNLATTRFFSIGTCYTPCHSLMDDVLSSILS